MENYITLLKDFVVGKISADEFEQQFLQLFKGDSKLLPGREFEILDKLFSDVDAYCSDSELIEDPRFDIGEAELRASAQEALEELVRLKVG